MVVARWEGEICAELTINLGLVCSAHKPITEPSFALFAILRYPSLSFAILAIPRDSSLYSPSSSVSVLRSPLLLNDKMESIGFVLATLPNVVTAIQQYRQILESIGAWRNYRPRVLRFSRNVNVEVTLFKENLEDLLSPIVTSDGEMATLLEDPGGPEWKDLAPRVKKRLPKSHDNYMETIKAMKETLEKLLKELHIVDGKVSTRFIVLLTCIAARGRRNVLQVQAFPDESTVAV